MGDEEIQVVTEWHGDILLNQIMEGADWGLAEWGMEAVALDKATTAVQTGALRNSKRTASPYYDGDDTQASKAGDLAEGSLEGVKRQIVDHSLAVGSWNDYAYSVELGDSTRSPHPSTLLAVDGANARLDEFVERGVQRENVVI